MILGSLRISIDDGPPVTGELTLDRETERVPTRGTVPDPGWATVDAAGHFHAYDLELATPTLLGKDRKVPCNGEHPGFAELGVPELEPEHLAPCDGYTVAEFFCHVCGEQVTPGRMPQHFVDIDKGERWEIVVPVDVPAGVEVSVRIMDEKVQRFGFAARVSQIAGGGPAGMWVRTTLVGIGRLATRSAVPAGARGSF
jgi:hypothetical protein